MNLHSGLPFWLVKSGLPHNYQPLRKNIKTDVAILGGGISGALVAYQMAEAGVNCVLIDARTIGLGSTVASTALLQYELDTPLFKLAGKVGLKNASKAYHLCNDSINEIGSIARKLSFKDFETKDSVYFAAAKKDLPDLEKEFKIREQEGFSVSWLDEYEVLNKFGFAAPGAIVSKHGAAINAYTFTHTLLQHAIKKGVPVFDRTNAASIVHNKNGVLLTTEEGFKIKTGTLVYATGFESLNYIDKKIAKLQSTYAIISENLTADIKLWKDESLLWNTADPYLYVRTTSDKRIICGGRDEDFFNPTKRDKLIPSKTKQLVKDFNKLFPGIPFKPEFSWTGVFATTPDGMPYMGNYKKLPNSFFALGFGGNGITFSQVAAKLFRQHLLKNGPAHLDIFSFDR